MSILIKGMEMPTNCPLCPCSDDESRYCRAANEYIPMLGHPKFCPLVEVPPHGRLIDADEMFIEFVDEGQRSKRYRIGEKWELNGEEIRGVISRLPTIIEAEVDDG